MAYFINKKNVPTFNDELFFINESNRPKDIFDQIEEFIGEPNIDDEINDLLRISDELTATKNKSQYHTDYYIKKKKEVREQQAKYYQLKKEIKRLSMIEY
tara:strand:+ start:59 stop:358 length:300 start_codon:yes stop_codon:yes gene_type:complete